MLSSLLIKNFKSCAEAAAPLASLTFLTGPNDSGRRSVLEALRLLHWLAGGLRLDDIERTIQSGHAPVRGRAADLFHDAAEGLSIGCRLDDHGDGWNELQIEIGMQDGHLVLQGEEVRSSSEALPLYRAEGTQQSVFCQPETPGLFFQEDARVQDAIPAAVQRFREQLGSIVFLDPNPAAMRGYSYAGDDALKEDGSNLSSVLEKLCRQEQTKQALLDFMCSLPEQNIDDISFIRTERGDVMVRLHESFGNKEQKTDAALLSDGTLRLLAVGAALLSAPEKALAVIQGIDSGIWPARAGILARQIQDIAARAGMQVLVCSNSSALLDAVPDAALGDVLCCCRNPEDGSSRIVRLADMKRFPELMAQGTLGQLMASGRLEKFLQDAASDEERRQAALLWLENLVKETAV